MGGARGAVVIDANTPGLPVPGAPFPFTGTWFRGNPVTITALPEPGSVFVRWQETGGTEATITVAPTAAAITRTAVFADAGGASGAPGVAPAAAPVLSAAPNPFNPRTELRFDLGSGGLVALEVFDIAGRRVRVLATATLPAGPHAWTWDGCDEAGRALPSGAYVARLRSPGGAATVKVQLVR
jgi:hypothetical protein